MSYNHHMHMQPTIAISIGRAEVCNRLRDAIRHERTPDLGRAVARCGCDERPT